jgi:transcriptional regulator with XRE-family HTH domain
MSGVESGPRNDGAIVSATLRAVRTHRRMTKAETAAGMNMPLRTYARFEAGDTRLNLDYVHRFAAATRSDPQAIFMAIAIGSPNHARRACDNQMGTIYTIALGQFDALIGDRIADISSRDLIAAIVGMFEALAEGRGVDDAARLWLNAGAEDLRARRPRPGRG